MLQRRSQALSSEAFLSLNRFQKLAFFTTANDPQGFPQDSLAEVAFAGRSNAGKSSAINTLANRNRLAFTSKTPGRTQHINFFTAGPGQYLVDLPGYGFAGVPLEIRRHWENFLSGYLQRRGPLLGLAVLMDIRHPLTRLDQQMLDWFLPSGRPVLLLLTKSDKLSRSQRMKVVREVRAAVAPRAANLSVVAFSSVSREGLEETIAVVDGWLAAGTALAEAEAASAAAAEGAGSGAAAEAQPGAEHASGIQKDPPTELGRGMEEP
ncbi:MAG: YihA family ribosome biogenesis GTP-binding protein [Pseudomonadota bacterium]|nr:YihA family ribosome biogenesis GTP-binding protein [Pseudomonadota bacterium]